MKLIIGLGNPGPEYARTRHNIGFMFVDFLAEKLEAAPFTNKKKFEAEITDVIISGEKVILVKPQTYMNDSGRAVSALANFYDVSPKDIIIVHDDLDITLGEYKIQTAKGPKVHNGLISIEQSLATPDFTRVRIGIDGRTSERTTSGKEYVLNTFSSPEMTVLQDLFQTLSQQLPTHQ